MFLFLSGNIIGVIETTFTVIAEESLCWSYAMSNLGCNTTNGLGSSVNVNYVGSHLVALIA